MIAFDIFVGLLVLLTFAGVTLMLVTYFGGARYRRKQERFLIAAGKVLIDHSKMWEAVLSERESPEIDRCKSITRRNRLELEDALNQYVKQYNEISGRTKKPNERGKI